MTETSNQPGGHDVISQIRIAGANPLPLTIGALLGALVPVGTFTLWHEEITSWQDIRTIFFLGGLMFSAITVFRWGQRAYGSTPKAFFFVLLAEGLMSFSETTWLSLGALGYLVCINAVANGCNLAVAHAARREADAARALALAPPSVDHLIPAVDAMAGLLAMVESRMAEFEAKLLRSAAGVPAAPALAESSAPAPQPAPEITHVAELAAPALPERNLAPRAPTKAKARRARKAAEPKARVTKQASEGDGSILN